MLLYFFVHFHCMSHLTLANNKVVTSGEGKGFGNALMFMEKKKLDWNFESIRKQNILFYTNI